jgi:hypothetical protein
MEQLPVYATQLVEELNLSHPHRCIRVGESEIDAHRYSAKRDLIDYLLSRLAATNSSDPTKPLLGRK